MCHYRALWPGLWTGGVCVFSSHSPTITWLEKETSWSGNSLECRRGFSELETHRRRLLTWRDPETMALSSRAEEERPLGGKTRTHGDKERRREETGHDRYKNTETGEQRQRETRARHTGEVNEIWEHIMISFLE